MKDDRLIRFDWAMKRLLRHKADHTILNGFLSSLLGTDIRIVSLLESEGNQESRDDKFNRVYLLAENDRHENFLIKVQNNSMVSTRSLVSIAPNNDYAEKLAEGFAKGFAEGLAEGREEGRSEQLRKSVESMRA
ncbi:MAG: PD-(D/E)XK nuclease family transposase, partial [Muribaculaceae bacterium]|nr:PD-(D/E)XK nuclease family transposase [Muribaculaceae bacterium]